MSVLHWAELRLRSRPVLLNAQYFLDYRLQQPIKIKYHSLPYYRHCAYWRSIPLSCTILHIESGAFDVCLGGDALLFLLHWHVTILRLFRFECCIFHKNGFYSTIKYVFSCNYLSWCFGGLFYNNLKCSIWGFLLHKICIVVTIFPTVKLI